MRAERQKAVARGKDMLTGTNAYPDMHETTPAVLDVAPATGAGANPAPSPPQRCRGIRLAEPFEELRDASDTILAKTGARPKIFLANLGTPADFTARASFAKNFFEAGGIEAVERRRRRRRARRRLQGRGAALACLCSSDKVYENEAAAAARRSKRPAPGTSISPAGRASARPRCGRLACNPSFMTAATYWRH